MIKQIKLNDSDYIFNVSDGNILNLDIQSAININSYLDTEVLDFFKKYDFGILKKLYSVIQPRRLHYYYKDFNEAIKNTIDMIKNSDFIEKNLQDIGCITFNVTEKCNFRCHYCFFTNDNLFKRKHTNKSMDFDVIKNSAKYLQNFINNKKVVVNFFGGEPVIEFDLIKKSMDFLKQNWKSHILYTITTNASLINDSLFSDVLKYDMTLAISLDGPKAIHNKNRIFADNPSKDSFELIFNLIKKIKIEHPKYYRKRVAFSIVITPDCNIDDFFNFFNENSDLFLNNLIKIVFENTTGSIARERNAANNFYSKLIDFYKNKILNESTEFNIFDYIFKSTFNQIMNKNKRTKSIIGRLCIPGNSRLFIDTNGSFFPCESLDYYACFGNYRDGFDFKFLKDLIVKFLNLMHKHCIDCWAFPFCKLCYPHAIDQGGISEKAFLKSCTHFKNAFEILFKLYLEIYEEKGYDLLRYRFIGGKR